MTESSESDPPGLLRSLTVGREYPVIGLLAEGRHGENIVPITIQIVDDDGNPKWFRSTLFTTTSAGIPANWVAVIDDVGALHVAPRPWLERGFWERWYEEWHGRIPRGEATEVYKRELDAILRLEGS